MTDTRTSHKHTVAEAMAMTQFDEEDVYFLVRFAGYHGYSRAMRRLSPNRLRDFRQKYLVWFGGWESPELCQWDLGWPAWRITRNPYPLTIFGLLTLFSGWGQLKIGRGYLVWPGKHQGGGIYWSPDGTPCHKRTRWLRSPLTSRGMNA